MEFSDALAHSIIEKVGERKEAWLVFDMDETLAHWKKVKKEDVFSLRPTVIPFLQKLINANIKIHFAIYSNTHSKSRVETIASTIGNAFEGNPLFHLCFLFYNHFKGNPSEVGLRRLPLNTNVSKIGNAKRELYDVNKTVESIRHGFSESGIPLTEVDIITNLFFFDDLIYPSIKSLIGKNYIQVTPFRGEEETPLPKGTDRSRGTKRNRNENMGAASKKPKARKTKRRAH